MIKLLCCFVVCAIFFVAVTPSDTRTTQLDFKVNGLQKTIKSINYTVQDTEVPDLLKESNFSRSRNETPKKGGKSEAIQLPEEEIQEVVGKTKDAELIDDGVEKDKKHVSVQETLKAEDGNSSVLDGQTAAILAGSFLFLSVMAYIGFLTWRRFLEIRYGNRQMLVNEDDFHDPDDLKNFSI